MVSIRDEVAVYNALMQYTSAPVPFSFAELVIDMFPLFLCTDKVTLANDISGYLAAFLRLSNDEDGAEPHLWNLAQVATENPWIMQSWKKLPGGVLGSWQRFVETRDAVDIFDYGVDAFMNSIAPQREATSDRLLECLCIQRGAGRIGQQASLIPNIIDQDIDDFMLTQTADIVYVDCTRMTIDEEFISGLKRPMILLTRKNRMRLPTWDCQEIGQYQIKTNLEVLQNEVARS